MLSINRFQVPNICPFCGVDRCATSKFQMKLTGIYFRICEISYFFSCSTKYNLNFYLAKTKKKCIALNIFFFFFFFVRLSLNFFESESLSTGAHKRLFNARRSFRLTVNIGYQFTVHIHSTHYIYL